MGYDGWFRLGGQEVANNERLAAYLANGIAPLDAEVTVESCDGLAAALVDSWEPYRTPLQDEAPWYDPDDPDTWDFAGILVTEATGLDDSTRTLDVITTLDGAGVAGRPTRGPRTVGMTAVLVGRTTAACQAGLTWLRTLLSGDCDADEQAATLGAPLEFLTTCPTPLARTADMDLPVETKYALTDPATWVARNGAVTDLGDGTIEFRPYDAVPTVDGGDATGDADSIDGGGADETGDLYDGGTAVGLGAGYLSCVVQQGCLPGPVTITWTLRGDYAGISVQGVILDAAGGIIDYGPKWDLNSDPLPDPDSSPDYTDWQVTWEVPFGIDADAWAPAIVSSDVLQVLTVEVTGYPLLPIDACINPVLRTLPGVVCTSGPTPTTYIDTGCETLMVVEWVWVSRSPYRYSPPTTLLTGLTWGGEADYTAPGVSYDSGGVLVSAEPWDCDPPALTAACAVDPFLPGFIDAPALPVVTDFRRVQITDEDGIRSMAVLVGPEQIPAGEGAFSITLTADADPIIGIRVRVYDDADADGTVPDDCVFAYEFLVDYIPALGSLTIDADTITAICGGLTTPQDASASVRGAYGGPIQPPVVRCDRRYLILVQTLDVFPRISPGHYTVGGSCGTMTVDLAVSTREG